MQYIYGLAFGGATVREAPLLARPYIHTMEQGEMSARK
jgi:hypothetical protein